MTEAPATTAGSGKPAATAEAGQSQTARLPRAATATALTSLIPTVEAAFPILILTYFPLIIISGVLFSIREPHWLSTFATYLPAQPLIDAVTTAVRATPGVPFLPARDMTVLAAWAVGGLLLAVFTFSWEPHRPAQRRPARTR